MRRCLFGIEISLDWLVHSYHKVQHVSAKSLYLSCHAPLSCSGWLFMCIMYRLHWPVRAMLCRL